MNKNILLLIQTIALVFITVALISSCNSTEVVDNRQRIMIDGKEIIASKDSPIKITYDTTKTNNNNSAGSAATAPVRAKGEIKDWNSNLPPILLKGISSGSSSWSGSILSATKNPMTIFFMLSGVVAILAIPVIIYISKPAGLLMLLCAGGLVATGLLGTFAPITFALSIMAIIGVVIYLYIDKSKAKKVKESLAVIVDKIEAGAKDEMAKLKSEIKKEDDGTIKKIVSEIKNA